ncbi:receptor-like protein kinase FERONIA [Benincasa hispida]|uniref:receptor-like protein kinase FERONIA n=1 Tax=Benincasa hispida TaxID=102211 RepID=UPI0018FFDB8F|nr:receptor-like protein kinase FERONIA [Benincasa hispida]
MAKKCIINFSLPTILFTFLYLRYLSLSVSGDSPAPYNPTDYILLNCGSSENLSSLGDERTWVSDVQSKFFPSDYNHNGASVISRAETQSSSVSDVPYSTARLSRSEFTYSFPLGPGSKFVRLYFYSAFYSDFDRFKAVFSVKTSLYTLLSNFNASANGDDPNSGTITREFCVYADGNDEMLNITFSPANPDSYAFINGIEIVSMPDNLFYTPLKPNYQGSRGLKHIGESIKFSLIDNYMSQVVFRENIGGRVIFPTEDTGMFRTWTEESNLLDGYLYDARAANLSIQLNYSKIPPYTAPGDVYRTARTMGPNATLNKSYNLTWAYPVDPGFYYILRLHFCEFEDGVADPGDRVFLIHIADMMAEESADVIQWAGGRGIPYRKDYILLMPNSDEQGKVNLSVKLQANPDDSKTRFTNVILNAIEIFKLTDSPIPSNLPQWPISQSKSSKIKTIAIVVPLVVVILVLGFFVFWRCKKFKDQSSDSDGTSQLSRNRIKTRTSKLPSELCRYFSLAQMRVATNNFDDIFIVGIGGFGNVYKGYIDDGATQVAIKRLKAGSKQGAQEFRTEIEMLSQLRHLHLVSLIGYCNEDNEMILVYDYMSYGTLQSHLYGNNIDERQPLSWKQRLQICIGAAKGLQYLHTGAKHTIIHRDVKTTNILLDDKWVVRVSDFGLSKVGATTIFKDYVTTMVKGSFGYLDPEYCRRLQLSEKSDVYSFGVVLCEVLCARPPLICTADKMHILLAEWVKRNVREKTITQIIDPKIKDEIRFECFRKFIQIVVSCIEEEGVKRPSMNDVMRGLEFASQLQESSNDENVELSGLDNVDDWLFGGGMSSNNIQMSTTSNNNSSFVYNKGMSGIVFSQLKDLEGR